MRIRSIVAGIPSMLLLAAGSAHAQALNNTDKEFLIMIARTNMTEAHEGEMAENQAARPEVKEFGKTLAQDHQQAYAELTALANKTGVSIPKGINTGKDRTIQQLMHLKGNTFDSQFARDEVAAHRRTLAAFQREADHGGNPDMKAYAAKMIAVSEKHLKLAQECAKPNGKS